MTGETEARVWKPRAFFMVVHRYVGLAIALFLIVAGLTGAPLAFLLEIENLLNPGVFKVEPQARIRLDAETLLARIHIAEPRIEAYGLNYGDTPQDSVRALVQARIDPVTGEPYRIDFSEAFVDPYDGRVLATREAGAIRIDRLHLMQFLYRLHYTLTIPGNVGVLLFGVAALLWTLDCFVGFYLTLPVKTRSVAAMTGNRRWWQRWKPAWKLRWNGSTTKLNFDLHRAGGLWFWIVMFVLAMSSVAFNLSEEIFQPAVRFFGPLTPDVFESLQDRSAAVKKPELSYSAAIARAEALLPVANCGSALSYISYLPENHAYWAVFQPKGKAYRALQLEYAQMFIDADTGALLARRTYAGGTAADKFIDWQFPLHSGQIMGLPGRILIAISGVVVVVLSITGVIIWWKKRQARRKSRMRSSV